MFIETKAWRWQLSENPSDLIVKTNIIEDIDDHQVLIENQAIGLNPVDWKLMSFFNQGWSKDQIPGVDGMGKVIAVGKKMQHIRLGTRYTYHTDLRFNGSYSYHTIVDGRAIIPVPDHISNITAAAFPCPALTAWQAFQKIPFIKGEHILVNGAGGSVGRVLAQLLIHAGAKLYVTASKHHHQTLLNYGAIQAFDYHDHDWKEQVKTALGHQSLYAAYDTVNGKSASELSPLLGFYGHLISIQDRVETAPLPAFTTSISLHEIALASTHVFGTDQQWSMLVQDGVNLLHQIANNQLKLGKIEVITFDQIPTALTYLKERNNGTKYVVSL